MEKGILDDNYIEQEDKFRDDIDFMDRWIGMIAEGFFVGIFAFILNVFAESIGVFGKGNNGMMHQKMLMILLFVVLNKDFLNGQSIVKYYYGYQIIDVKTRKPASEIQCVIRNFPLILNWIILIVATIFPRKRMGDALAGTMLVRVKKEKSIKVYFSKMTKNKWGFNFWFSLVITGFYSWVMVGGGFHFLRKVME